MILQNVILPSTSTCTEESMYFRRNKCVDYTWCNDKIEIHPNGEISFDTYFNGFSAEKWFKYTKVKKVFITLFIKGKVRITMLRKEKIGDRILTEFTGEHICVSEDDQIQSFSFPFDTSSSNGMYCFQLLGLDAESFFYGANYNAEISKKDLNNVKIAIDICTYKREKFVEGNLALLNERFLNNKDSALNDKLEVFISDNAHTLNSEKLSGDKIHIFQNKNVGGAGGFTRGMIEIKKVKKEKNITHILVMDDDIVIEPESLYRTYAMFTCVKDEYKDAFIGGAMLRLDNRYFQTESGAVWNGGKLISLKHGLDFRTLDACLFNEFEENPQFNAWWYCAFPVDVVTDENLPLPIFIRGDDVEYGLRNMKHLILMNGICVWHEPFENKYSSFLYYYILRNRLIDNALHNMVLPKKEFISILRSQVMDELRLYRYKNAELLMDGVEDFFKGVDWLRKQDGEALHQSVMKKGYKMQYIEDMNEQCSFNYPLYEQSLRDCPVTDKKSRAINHYTVNGTFLPPKRAYNIVPTVGACMSSIYRVNTVLNYDYASRKGFVTRRDTVECKRLINRLKKLTKCLVKNYDSGIVRFSKESGKLKTLDFWNGYLNLK